MSIKINVPDHILFEDSSILVINKPCSLMVEPDRNGHPNLLQQVQKYERSLRPKSKEIYVQHVHRLDRPVSGIVLFARKKSVLKNLSEQFANRQVKKYYQAITETAPTIKEGKLENYLWKDKKNKQAVIVDPLHAEAEKVLLDYKITPYKNNFHLWDIRLHTGKFHQIRAQLAASGCPILGDALYGSKFEYAPNSIALHASSLYFNHPQTGDPIQIKADPLWLI
ncbi:MAG: RluA family pseudouridine synthase [Sporocytophaga sp.]|uniref:RluA family pseudouridine synthase n=1 Tax=Sporocytophaga sp. TaxID=2231183 RepID=UPI001B1FC3D5|nr:RluA family pseudouridine synthase [Sporocytophaga sp.]MBO9700538.1 RluA family pseudouridine synthase [Sporocytophaga sp.]